MNKSQIDEVDNNVQVQDMKNQIEVVINDELAQNKKRQIDEADIEPFLKMITIGQVQDKKKQVDEADIVAYMSLWNINHVPFPFTIQGLYPDVIFTFNGDCQCLPGVICIEHARRRKILGYQEEYYIVQMKECQKKHGKKSEEGWRHAIAHHGYGAIKRHTKWIWNTGSLTCHG